MSETLSSEWGVPHSVWQLQVWWLSGGGGLTCWLTQALFIYLLWSSHGEGSLGPTLWPALRSQRAYTIHHLCSLTEECQTQSEPWAGQRPAWSRRLHCPRNWGLYRGTPIPPPLLSKTNFRSQEQMCPLADMETPFKVPGLNPPPHPQNSELGGKKLPAQNNCSHRERRFAPACTRSG